MRISIAIVSLLPFDALAIEWLSLWCVYFTDSVSVGGFHRLLASVTLTSMPAAYRYAGLVRFTNDRETGDINPMINMSV